jgi:hypothetical protein
MMRWEESQGTKTYLTTNSLYINAIDLWILGGITDSLQDRCLSRIRPPDNEDSELNGGEHLGEILL